MKLDELKQAQMQEIMEWADEVDKIITPDSVVPEHLKDFPLAMEVSTRLKLICKTKAKEVKDKVLAIEDIVVDSIEQQEYIFKLNGGGQPVTKKKFPTAEKQKRELRRRLALDCDWRDLKEEATAWELMYSDWVAHHDRLRREMHILEKEYDASGSAVWERKDVRSFNPHKNRVERTSK